MRGDRRTSNDVPSLKHAADCQTPSSSPASVSPCTKKKKKTSSWFACPPWSSRRPELLAPVGKILRRRCDAAAAASPWQSSDDCRGCRPETGVQAFGRLAPLSDGRCGQPRSTISGSRTAFRRFVRPRYNWASSPVCDAPSLKHANSCHYN